MEIRALVAVTLRVQVAVAGFAHDLLARCRGGGRGHCGCSREERCCVGQDIGGRGTGPAADDLFQGRGPGPVEGRGENAYPGVVGDGRRLLPGRGVDLEAADHQFDGQVRAALIGQCPQAHPPLGKGGIRDVRGPAGGLGGVRAPGLDLDSGAFAADTDRPVRARRNCGGEGGGGGQLGDRVRDLLLKAQFDRARGQEGQPGPVVVVSVLVAEGQRVRAGLAGGHFVELRDRSDVDVGDLVVSKGGMAACVVGGERDGGAARYYRVVGVGGPQSGPVAAGGGGPPVLAIRDRECLVREGALEVVQERLLVLGEGALGAGQDDGLGALGQDGDALGTGGDLQALRRTRQHARGEGAEGDLREVGGVQRSDCDGGPGRGEGRGSCGHGREGCRACGGGRGRGSGRGCGAQGAEWNGSGCGGEDGKHIASGGV